MAEQDVNDTPYNIDVISVGDTVIDDFIRLFEDQGKVVDEGKGERWLSVPYGMKVPFEKSTTIWECFDILPWFFKSTHTIFKFFDILFRNACCSHMCFCIHIDFLPRFNSFCELFFRNIIETTFK